MSLAICSVVDEAVHHEPSHDASFDLELFSSRCRIAHHEGKSKFGKTPIWQVWDSSTHWRM